MSRCKDAPIGFECPYRHQCPHLDTLSTTWVMEVYQESFELRERLHRLETDSQRRIEELQKMVLERDQTIAQLRLQHQKQFKANVKPTPPPIKVKARRRGAPVGHPPWRRKEPDHVDHIVNVAAPTICPKCRREVYQTAPGELRNCSIGPVTRAVAAHLRYDLQIPYRKVQHILCELFGMPMVHATAMNFDRKATALGRPLYEKLKVMLQSADVVYADETSWRQDGQGHYVWFGGNDQLAVYQITDNRSAESAVELLGKEFDGALVTDAYAAYNAVEAKHRQTCWNHLRTKAKEIEQQIDLAGLTAKAPLAVDFCGKLQRFALRQCELGRKVKSRKLSRAKAKAMIPALGRQLRRFASQKLDHEAAETLRVRVMEKDRDKLFTFLRVKGVEPTNNHAERSLRFLVIMRKICFGTRSPAGSESHGVLASLLQTARLQGKNAIEFLTKLFGESPQSATAMMFADAK